MNGEKAAVRRDSKSQQRRSNLFPRTSFNSRDGRDSRSAGAIWFSRPDWLFRALLAADGVVPANRLEQIGERRAVALERGDKWIVTVNQKRSDHACALVVVLPGVYTSPWRALLQTGSQRVR